MKYFKWTILLCGCLLQGCSEEDEMCVENTFQGTWNVESHTIVENLTTHSINESTTEFVITFLEAQTGFFDTDSLRTFIWGTNCEPATLLISVENDTTSSTYYSTSLFSIDVPSIKGNIELERQSISAVQDTIYKINYNWLLTK